jgi:hypothetical protein
MQRKGSWMRLEVEDDSHMGMLGFYGLKNSPDTQDFPPIL